MESVQHWTVAQLLGLAPDALTARAAERLVILQEWQELGQAPGLVWGRSLNPGSNPVQAAFTRPDLRFACNCGSRKWPCRHAVGLAALFALETPAFPASVPPDWAEIESLREISRSELHEPEGTAFTSLPAVQRGMAQLETWLRDIVHRGLAGLEGQPVTFWREMAARLADAGAPLTAQDLRDLIPLAGSAAGWPEEMLRRLGRLYLLAQGFARYEALPPETQADLRAAAGWLLPLAPGVGETVVDRWLVLGSTAVYDGQEHWVRFWLWGARTRRYAELTLPARPAVPRPALPSGSTIRTGLCFSPGGWPVHAEFSSLHEFPAAEGSLGTADPPASLSIAAARSACGRALSLNPWLRDFPMLLCGVSVATDGTRWELLDQEGQRLPLPPGFLYGWHLLALAADAPEGLLFGEWNGRFFTPLTIQIDGLWLPLHALRGQK